MRIDRVYVDAPIVQGRELALPGPQSHRLGKVLRLREGQCVSLFNGAGGCFHARITAVIRNQVTVIPGDFRPDAPDPGLRINLAQGISRGRHMDYTIQKATELGVTRIEPLITEHSNVRLEDEQKENKLSHWRNIIIAACEQCGRNVLPEITAPAGYQDWIARGSATIRLILAPEAAHTLTSLTRPAVLTIISGPEGGLSESEYGLAADHGCIPIRLGPRVLRTETAAIAAISACQTLWGDMG
jgi:16S rRNA (uracil1498-N3)-methyltransferase